MFTRVSYVQETVEDLNVAFGNLQGAGGHQTLQRRALKATLDNLYRLRAHRAEAQTYLRRSDSCDAGRITEGITYLRGVLTHHITKPVAPENQPLYPGDDVYPSEDLFPGTNLTWLDASDVFRMQPQPAGGQRKVQAEFYRSHVGGRLVLPTIRVAREFLINDSHLGPL
jgi:hypothetical protein